MVYQITVIKSSYAFISEAIDTRFTFVAFCTTYLLGRLDDINVEKAVEFILKCHNFDGGFGTRPGSESHSGQVYCCIGSLAIAGCLEKANLERTAEWLADRQCPSGGLCGTVEESEKIGVTGYLHKSTRHSSLYCVLVSNFFFCRPPRETARCLLFMVGFGVVGYYWKASFHR